MKSFLGHSLVVGRHAAHNHIQLYKICFFPLLLLKILFLLKMASSPRTGSRTKQRRPGPGLLTAFTIEMAFKFPRTAGTSSIQDYSNSFINQMACRIFQDDFQPVNGADITFLNQSSNSDSRLSSLAFSESEFSAMTLLKLCDIQHSALKDISLSSLPFV